MLIFGSWLSNTIVFNDLQVRDFRTDWDLQVNQPIAGNYYPVCLFMFHLSFFPPFSYFDHVPAYPPIYMSFGRYLISVF